MTRNLSLSIFIQTCHTTFCPTNIIVQTYYIGGTLFMKGNIRSYRGKVLDFTKGEHAEYEEWNQKSREMELEESSENLSQGQDYHNDPNGEFFEERQQISSFCKVGIAVLTLILIIGATAYLIPKTIAASSSGTRKLPIYCVNTDEPKVALSFDAAWGNEQTQTILDICAKHDIKVTFFMTGTWIEKYPESVKAIAAAGHELGNHSENHKQMSQLSKQQCIDELMKPHEKVKELTGIEMKVFRPPFGDYNNTLIEAATECNYHTIQWDVDTLVM